jgi:anthranilate/para-aminobenzoate synthase component I
VTEAVFFVVTTLTISPTAAVDRLLVIAETLPPPFILLEDGRGAGRTHLVWGVRRRRRLPWGMRGKGGGVGVPAMASGDIPFYGVFAYETGIPEWVDPSPPALPQPFADAFQPENRIILEAATGMARCEGPDAEARWHAAATDPGRLGLGERHHSIVPWRSFDEATFEAAVEQAREYIAAGDIYQVNLAVAERWPLGGTAWQGYRRLREVNPSPWMGFADFGDWQLVCGSPELLVEVGTDQDGTFVRTRPIAGTRKKTGSLPDDARMRSELRLDAKERAEHLMLVDLARNDIGRVARYGTVAVIEQEVVEEYSHVFHLVSEVRGRLWPGRTSANVVDSLFPGGTITGCPKIRAMEIIAELERVGRGAYTGALGWIAEDSLQLNIVIRSAVVADGHVLIQAGAGIVADSIPAREWRESLRKAEAIRVAFGLRVPGA